jgi:hypothetical protein
MAFSKESKIDCIEIIDFNVIQVRTCTSIFEDTKLLSKSYHREVLLPGTDLTDKDPAIAAIANIIWIQPDGQT